MNKFVISTESCADILKSEMDAKKIHCIIMKYIIDNKPVEVIFNSGKEYDAFYALLMTGIMPTTSQINPFEYKEFFLSILSAEKKDIVHFALSSGLSSSALNAKIAAEEINNESEHKVYVVDTLCATQGMAFLVDECVRMRDDGMDAITAFEKTERDKHGIHHLIIVGDLYHLKRGGRVSAASAVVGTLLHISPILIMNSEGKLQVIDKAKGRNGIKKIIMRNIGKSIENGENLIFYTAATDDPKLEQEVLEEILTEYKGASTKKGRIGPVIGTHTGGSTLGIVFKGTERK